MTVGSSTLLLPPRRMSKCLAMVGFVCEAYCISQGKRKWVKSLKVLRTWMPLPSFFIEEMDKGKDNTLAAFSTAASNDDGLKVENLVGASPAQVALLQNEHMKIGQLSLVWKRSYTTNVLSESKYVFKIFLRFLNNCSPVWCPGIRTRSSMATKFSS